MWRSESRFHVFLFQLVLKNNWYEVCFETKHKKDKQRAARWGEIKINSFVTTWRYKPNWCSSVFAALRSAEYQRTCSTLKGQWSAVELEVIILWCHWLNDGFKGLERAPHKEVKVMCWTQHMQVLKTSGSISTTNWNLSVRGRSRFDFDHVLNFNSDLICLNLN